MRVLAAALMSAALVSTAPLPVAAAQEPTVTSQGVESFDGTRIFTTLFLPAGASDRAPVPLVMRSHGWGGTGERSLEAASSTTRALLDAGYAVLTWDERGFGWSGGEIHVLKPDLEGKDAVALLDWVVGNVPEVAREPGDASDPIVGMSGGSYAGAIQTLLSSLDDRVDAIAPEITWSDLRYSLYENEVINLGWGQLLYAAGQNGANRGAFPDNPLGPQLGEYSASLHQAEAEGATLNEFSESTQGFFGGSSLAVYGDTAPIDVPTLVMQGSVDTLFDLTDGNGIFQHVKDQGAPARYVIFCGGHVSCPGSYTTPDTPDRDFLDQAILDWFAKHLRGEDVDTGATVTYRTNAGEWRDTDDFTPSAATFLTATAEGTVVNAVASTQESPDGGLTDLTGAKPSQDGDPRALIVEVAAAEGGPLELVGLPKVAVSVTGEGQTHLFFKLVDRETGEVVNLQETPLRVEGLSGEAQEFGLTMSGIAYTLPEGHHLDLHVATNSVMHATSRLPGQADVTATVEVPVLGGAAATGDGTSAGGEDPAADAPQGALADTGGGAAAVGALAMVAATLSRRRR